MWITKYPNAVFLGQAVVFANTASVLGCNKQGAGAQAKPKSSFSSFSNAFSSVLSVTSSGRSPPELVPEAHLASCSGNWLSHLDWDGRRCEALQLKSCKHWL